MDLNLEINEKDQVDIGGNYTVEFVEEYGTLP